MKKLILFLFIASLLSIKSQAQDDEMKKWMEYMTPAKEHQMLAKDNGEWKFFSKYWMDPSTPPSESEGTASFEMILGGRYSMSKHKGNMMGMDFEGINIVGYDNAKKVYVNMWIDNMGTGMMYAEGKYDESSKTFVFTGKYFDPMTGKDEDYKETMKTIDENNFLLEMFMFKEEKAIKNMEIKFTRK